MRAVLHQLNRDIGEGGETHWSELNFICECKFGTDKTAKRELDMFDKYVDRWDWFKLSCDFPLPLTERLIEKYEDRWDWDYLVANHVLPTTNRFIERYADKLDTNIYLSRAITSILRDY